MNRRNLSGVYIFHKFEDEDKEKPTCFEDLPEQIQDEWLDVLDREAISNLAKHLANTIRTMGDQFNISME